MKFWHSILKHLSLKHFYARSRWWAPILGGLSLMGFVIGLYLGLYRAPLDYQQGDAFRIMYVHVPAAFLSLLIYSIMGLNAVLFLVWRLKLCDMIAHHSAAIGANYTLIALITGALWGKPMWGTWWVWDARLSSEFILLLLYLGYQALRRAIPDPLRAAKASALLAMIGWIDVPIIHFSVQWWATLHQGPSISAWSKPSIAPVMLYPLIIMILAFFLFYASLLLVKIRSNILMRESQSLWIKKYFSRTVLE
jgi:heme exporter protein C